MEWRASSLNLMSFAIGLFNNSHEVFLTEHEVFNPVDFNLIGAVFLKDDLIADLDRDRRAGPVFEQFARTDGHHLSLLRLLLRGIRKDDSRGSDLLVLDRLHDDPIPEWTKLHTD